MLKSSFCDYADVYVVVKGTITITGEQEMMMQQNDSMKEIRA